MRKHLVQNTWTQKTINLFHVLRAFWILEKNAFCNWRKWDCSNHSANLKYINQKLCKWKLHNARIRIDDASSERIVILWSPTIY